MLEGDAVASCNGAGVRDAEVATDPAGHFGACDGRDEVGGCAWVGVLPDASAVADGDAVDVEGCEPGVGVDQLSAGEQGGGDDERFHDICLHL